MNGNSQDTMQVINVPIEDIIPNRFQPRLSFDEDGLRELANSIKEHGIIQPLVVRRLAEKYEIIAGERRYKAAKLAGFTQVPVIVNNMDDQKSAEAAIVENIQRRDLSAIEEAKSYQTLIEKDGITQEQLAKKMGLSQSAISNKLRLLTLAEPVQNALIDGRISERHARSLLQISDKNEQEEWLNKIIDSRLTVRDLDKQIKQALNKDGNLEAPIVDNNPNIEEIKSFATDIVNPFIEKPQDIVSLETTTGLNENKQMPNKFFNFLEDESVSMNMNEDNNNTIDNEPLPKDEAPEEIEMLDFSPARESLNFNNSELEELFNNFIDNLKLKNYNVLMSKEENNNKFIYTLEIDK